MNPQNFVYLREVCLNIIKETLEITKHNRL